MPMIQAHLNAEFWVEVKHRRPLPKRYTWEIHCKGVCLWKFTAKECAFPWKSHAVSLAPGKKPVRSGIGAEAVFAGELIPTRSSAFYEAPAR
jgi:hypothetical protein